MAQQKIRAGIDIGTYQVKVVITEDIQDASRTMPRVLGIGFAESKGMRHGYIINVAEVARSVRIAADQAEKTAGVKITEAYVAIGGIGLTGITSNGTAVITRADNEITELDVTKAIQQAEADLPKSATLNRKIIQTIPIQFKIDGQVVLGRPHGLKANKLEARVLVITCIAHHVEDIILAVEEAGVAVEDVIAAPIAASFVTLNKIQKMQGCVLANIGAETVSIIVFENNLPISLEVFAVGSTNVTNDIALGLRIPIEEAETVKMGSAYDQYPKKKLDEIIEARMSDMFELIEAHLKKIGRSGLLPAGIIMTGGGSGLQRLIDHAKSTLKLPSKVASFTMGINFKTPIKDATWAVAYGLCILGAVTSHEEHAPVQQSLKKSVSSVLEWFKQFLP